MTSCKCIKIRTVLDWTPKLARRSITWWYTHFFHSFNWSFCEWPDLFHHTNTLIQNEILFLCERVFVDYFIRLLYAAAIELVGIISQKYPFLTFISQCKEQFSCNQLYRRINVNQNNLTKLRYLFFPLLQTTAVSITLKQQLFNYCAPLIWYYAV